MRNQRRANRLQRHCILESHKTVAPLHSRVLPRYFCQDIIGDAYIGSAHTTLLSVIHASPAPLQVAGAALAAPAEEDSSSAGSSSSNSSGDDDGTHSASSKSSSIASAGQGAPAASRTDEIDSTNHDMGSSECSSGDECSGSDHSVLPEEVDSDDSGRSGDTGSSELAQCSVSGDSILAEQMVDDSPSASNTIRQDIPSTAFASSAGRQDSDGDVGVSGRIGQGTAFDQDAADASSTSRQGVTLASSDEDMAAANASSRGDRAAANASSSDEEAGAAASSSRGLAHDVASSGRGGLSRGKAVDGCHFTEGLYIKGNNMEDDEVCAWPDCRHQECSLHAMLAAL